MKRIFITIAIAGLFTATACNQAAEKTSEEVVTEEGNEMLEEMNDDMESAAEEVEETVTEEAEEMIEEAVDTLESKTEEVIEEVKAEM